MSHFTTIRTQIKDLDALNRALDEMQLIMLAETSARGYGNELHGDYVIRLQGPYDVALNKQPDGSYDLTTDWWGEHVEKEVGKDFGKLMQLYGVHKSIIEAKKKGYTALRKALPNGSIKLTLTSL